MIFSRDDLVMYNRKYKKKIRSFANWKFTGVVKTTRTAGYTLVQWELKPSCFITQTVPTSSLRKINKFQRWLYENIIWRRYR